MAACMRNAHMVHDIRLSSVAGSTQNTHVSTIISRINRRFGCHESACDISRAAIDVSLPIAILRVREILLAMVTLPLHLKTFKLFWTQLQIRKHVSQPHWSFFLLQCNLEMLSHRQFEFLRSFEAWIEDVNTVFNAIVLLYCSSNIFDAFLNRIHFLNLALF